MLSTFCDVGLARSFHQIIRTRHGHNGVVSRQRGTEPVKAAGITDPPEPAVVDEPVISDRSGDDRDEGWGDDPRDGRRDEQWYRRERPPHHE
jgi:hypothetical protein